MKLFCLLPQLQLIPPGRSSLGGIFALFLVFVVALPWLSGCAPLRKDAASVHGEADALAAEQLYDEAWRMIRQEYVDASFNHQEWNYWRDRFKGRLKDPDDAYVAIATMVASLNDEYTRFLRPRDMDEQNMSISSRLYGVGIQISMRDNKLVVLATIDDTPAEEAGLMPKDQITRINGHQTAGLSVEDAADRIRGEKDTYVVLTVKRGNREFEKRIQRKEIRLKSVFTRELDDRRIGYVRLSSFISESMPAEMNDIMRKMRDKHALIIDLRGNYGGLFTNAVYISDLFLDHGAIVSIVNREHAKRVYEAAPGVVFNRPLVVLIDGGSASASEILSGALKDNHRAVLVGSQSFGKGLVQKINPLSNGAGLNITISKYLTPNGTDINKKGIDPDIPVHFTERDFESHRDTQLLRAVAYLEGRLKAAR